MANFWLCASVLFLFLGCRPAAKPARAPLSGPVKLWIIYHEKKSLLGGNVRLADGVGEYVFQNAGDKPVTLVLPPSEVLSLTDYPVRGTFPSWQKRVPVRATLAEEYWPEFLKEATSFTLAPGEKKIFTSPFSMDLPKSAGENAIVANLLLVFERGRDERGGPIFSGHIVGESTWKRGE
ncbi:MAG: hypothetical protein ACYC0Y_27330 [Pirellulales bacterium]